MAYLAETIVFAYLGLSACAPRAWHDIDGAFVALVLASCVVGRVANILPLAALLNLCRPSHARITIRMQMCLVVAGLRGAVAFALALSFPEPSRQVS